MAVLAARTRAHAVTGVEGCLEARAAVMEEHHYDVNAETEASYVFRCCKWSGDGDELATQSWFTLLQFEQDPALLARWRDGWAATYANIQQQQGAWWEMANAVLGGEPEPGFEATGRWLRQAPVDMIRWNVHNSHRLDLVDPPAFYDGVGAGRSDGRILPYDERACERWNTSQYRLDGGFGAAIEMDGADVLAPYWMGRYHGLIVSGP